MRGRRGIKSRLEERRCKAIVKKNFAMGRGWLPVVRKYPSGSGKRKDGLQAEAVLAFTMVGEGLLPVGLLLGQPADDGQLEALAVEGAHEDDDQDDEEYQIDQLP